MSAQLPARRRADRREVILGAAFDVFARRGFTQASVQEIADAAGVAKPTLYNHFADKDELFRCAMTYTADAVTAANVAVTDRLRATGANLEAALVDVARRLLRVCCDDRSRALRRLAQGQLTRFPDVLELVQERTSSRLAEALADRIARLSLSGGLRRCDPAVAAEQFLALLTAPMDSRSGLGTRRVPVTDVNAVADAAVDTFLRAYGVT
ncbi:TetR/AcrR family transcriptional regulator [Actinophytocola oryzae]|uniref:TetR family transcriptional regulator n=1 Tax=Actinophytocola oryzae TaxID=502181 RepID=A0A4R7UTC9_9PSEU|nr:TetR/AcrR family transcriptional regulator [Actinophytocola oryzae]TDV37753.1 TetR family transcriptional regulator [Actinophytocola oryzae]